MPTAGQTEPPPIRILILGPPLVTHHENPVRIIRREIRAVLYYLAASLEPVSRIAACDLFWNRDDETTARKKLREGLSRLRGFLGEPDALVTEDDFVSLNTSLVYTDYREFEKIITPLLTSSEMTSIGKLPDWCYSQLRKAMQLCRGTQFLQGFSLPGAQDFENWLAFNNHSYSVKREKVLQRLVDHAISAGNCVEAMLWIGKALETDPLNTDMNFLMLNCLKETGQSREAVAYLNLLEPRYRASHLEDLPQTLKDFKFRLSASPTFHRVPAPEADWPGSAQESSPFVGREVPLNTLTSAYYRRGLVQISGERGSGKSRLVKEFYFHLPYKPTLIFCNVRPNAFAGDFSFLIDALRPYVSQGGLDSLPDQAQEILRQIFNSGVGANHFVKANWAGSASFEDKQDFFEAFLCLFESLAVDKPLLLVVENTQWLDLPTLEMFTFFHEAQFFKRHGLLVLIARKEEPNPGLEAYLDWTALVSDLGLIDLQPFSLQETDQLVSLMVGKSVSQDAIQTLNKRTGGNPYLLVEIIKALREKDLDPSEREGFGNILPVSVTSTVKKKIRFLTEQAENILSCAAVCGNLVDLRVLEAISGLEEGEFLHAVEELLRAGIMVQSASEKNSLVLQFLHGITREVVLQGLSLPRSRSLHLAAVNALQKIHGEAPELAGEFAFHFETAAESLKAFDAWRRSGRFESARFERERSYAAYQKAADLLEKLPVEIQSSKLPELIEDWGNYAYDLDDLATCRFLYELGMKIGEKNQDARLIAASLLGLGRLAEMQGNLEEGIDTLHRALFFLEKLHDTRNLIETHSRLGFLFEMKHDFRRAKEVFEDGLQIEKDPGDLKTLDSMINLETRQALLLCMMGFPARAEEIAMITANESLLVPRQSAKIQAYAALATARLYCGKFSQAIQAATAVYQMAQQYGLERWQTLLDLVLAKSLLAQGNLDECWTHVHKAMKSKNIAVMKDLDLFSNEILGDIYRLLGDFSTAEDLYRQGARDPLDNLQSLENYYLLGLVQYQQGRVEEGLKTIQDAALRAETLGLEAVSMPAGFNAAVLTLGYKTKQQTTRVVEPFLAKMEERGFGPGIWNANLILGELASRQGDTAQAREKLLETLAASREMGHRWIELWALSELSVVQDFENDERSKYQGEARAILEEMSRHALLKPLRALFRRFEKKNQLFLRQ